MDYYQLWIYPEEDLYVLLPRWTDNWRGNESNNSFCFANINFVILRLHSLDSEIRKILKLYDGIHPVEEYIHLYK